MTTRSRYNYHAYKLRLWQQEAPGGWWGCLQNTTTGKYTFFKTLDDLFMYLNSQVRSLSCADLSGLEPTGPASQPRAVVGMPNPASD